VTPKDLLVLQSRIMALILSSIPGISHVALSGSLARNEKSINDIDLIALHFLGSRADMLCRINQPIESKIELCTINQSDVGYFTEYLLDPIRLQLSEVLTAEDKVDIIFVQDKILYDCSYLANLSKNEKNEDFYKVIFCDIPLLKFSRAERDFVKKPISHGRECCKPRIAWKERKLRMVVEKKNGQHNGY